MIAQGEIDIAQVEEVLTSAALAAGLEPDEISATLESGLTNGQANPRQRNRKNKKRIKCSLRADPLLAKLSKLGESDTDNAQRLLKRYGNHLRFVPERQRWFAFDKRTWREDTGGQHVSFGQKSARLIANEAGLLKDGERSRERQDWGLQSLGSGRVRSALEMARPHATRSVTEFDADPWLLNVRNGTLDLRTSELRPYDPTDYLTRLAGTTYEPEAKCPRFRRFLRESFADDEELIGFLRRYVGYTLTGSTREQCFLFLQGEGKNGKSTLIGIVQEMLGDYARTVPKGTLLAKFKASSISNDLARLAGARMVSAIESNPNEQLDEALVKQITGGDRLAARFLYGEFFEFTPELKLWYAANHPPRLRSTDDALWRRIHVLPFEVAVPTEQLDPDLLMALRTELPGILTWAVRGCRQWQRCGLQPPQRVVAATNQYRKEVDHVRRFLQDCVSSTNGPPTRSKIVYDRYERWCSENGERGVSMKALAAKLTEAAFSPCRLPGTGHRAWQGLTIRE